MRILSIEDDAELQHLMSLALRAEGWRVDYAFTGIEGYEKALALAPDLIVCDLMLPGLNGPELIAKLKAQPALRDVPIIVTTAYYDAPSMVEANIRRLGVIEYVRKPVRAEELVRMIRRLIQGSAGRSPPSPGPAKGRVRLDPSARALWVDDRLAGTLPRLRFAALRLLVEAGGPVARAELMSRLWSAPVTRVRVDKLVERLRRDLGEASELLKTTPGGYELAG
jgi:DNA-binding response OmpR family regulator